MTIDSASERLDLSFSLVTVADPPPGTASEDFSEFAGAGVPSMMFNIGVYDQERIDAARSGAGPPIPSNHSPLFAPVPKPTIETGVTAMTRPASHEAENRVPSPVLVQALPSRLHCRPTSRVRARRPAICANGRK